MAARKESQLVTRTIKVEEMVCPECGDIIVEALAAIIGENEIKTDWRKSRVTVTYDLNQTGFHEIEKLLSDIGYPPDNRLLQRLKRDLTRFTEKNQQDNMKHVPGCCSKPPTGA